MIKKLFILLLVSSNIIAFAQNNNVEISLECIDNTTLTLMWQIKPTILPDNIEIYIKDGGSPNFLLYNSISNPLNNSSAKIEDLILPDYTYHITVVVKDISNTFNSDTLSPIYITLGGGSISQPYPTIRCPKYPVIYPDTLLLFRKIPYEDNFVQVNPVVETETSFIDNTLVGVCDASIFYYVSNKKGNSVSAIKSSIYSDSNPPAMPHIKCITLDNNGDLVIKWNPSGDKDIEYYKIDSILPYGTWQNKQIVNGDTYYFPLFNDFCQQADEFTIKYRILGVDSCGNNTVWDLNEVAFSPLIFNQPFVYQCNKVRFSWNNAHCSSDDINKYFIKVKNLTSNNIDTITINNTELIVGNNSIVFDKSIHYFNESTIYEFNLFAISETDTIFTCTQQLEIQEIYDKPDTLSIQNITYNKLTECNSITILVDKAPKSDLTYVLYAKRSANQIDTLQKFTPPLNSEIIVVEDNIKATTYYYTYCLISIDECGMVYEDSSYMTSIYLLGEESADEQLYRLCFSPVSTNNEYDTIIYSVKREASLNKTTTNEYDYKWCYTNPVGSNSFCSYCNTQNPVIHNYCDNDIGFYYDNPFSSIEWIIEAKLINKQGGFEICKSNPVTLFSEIQMPNALLLNASNDINRRFGPMNINPQNSYNIKSVDFVIFNSLGEIIWHSSNELYWDGKTLKGRYVPIGTYLYSIIIELDGNNKLQKRGSVTVLTK